MDRHGSRTIWLRTWNELFAYPLHQMHVGTGKRRSYRAVYTMKATEVHVLTIRRAAQDTIELADLPLDV